MPSGTSETSTSRHILAPFCAGLGLDIGFGRDKVVPHAISFDMPTPYTCVGGDEQIMRGDCRDLRMFCDESLDYIYSSHLLEDFTYEQLIPLIGEWRRVLKVGGRVVTNCPDQQRFLSHCAATGQGLNLAHKEANFSLQTFKDTVLAHTGPWEVQHETPEHGPYSWLLVVAKA